MTTTWRHFRFSLFALLLVQTTLGVAADEPAARALPPADLAWQEIETLRTGPLSQRPRELPALEALRRSQQLCTELTAQLESFYDAYPTDRRRWDAVLALRRYTPLFLREVGPDAANPLNGATFDEAARIKHAALLDSYEAALLAAADATEAQKHSVETGQARRRTAAAAKRGRAATRAEWEQIFVQLDAFTARHGQTADGLQTATELVNRALIAYENAFPADAIDFWGRYVAFPDDRLATVARAKLAARQLMSAPIDLTFTAADGREVDLRKLRGKVVLIDFWATWCGPCIAELPNVKQVYAAYQAQGFEVVGITLENPGFRPGDTPEQREQKLGEARRKMLAFATREQLPWPQHFDGRWWDNEVSRRFGISAIPAMLLLDQEGRVVTTDARGPQLAAEVRRLLQR